MGVITVSSHILSMLHAAIDSRIEAIKLISHHIVSAKVDEAILKTLIKRSHQQRMVTKEHFKEMYDLVSWAWQLVCLFQLYHVICLLKADQSALSD